MLEGKKCPKFKAKCTSELNLSNEDFIGKNLVIYFYPKDSTPGCTIEGQEFRDNYKYFKKLNTEILGVSRDSIKSHENFKSKQAFPFELLSDPDEKVCRAFDVMKLTLQQLLCLNSHPRNQEMNTRPTAKLVNVLLLHFTNHTIPSFKRPSQLL